MRKIIILILAFTIVFSFTACGGGKENPPAETNEPTDMQNETNEPAEPQNETNEPNDPPEENNDPAEPLVNNNEAPASDFKWEIIDGGVEIKLHLTGDEEVHIPATIEGLPVISIGNLSFSGSVEGAVTTTLGIKALKKVIIPETVTRIGSSAFSQTMLESIVIPDSVTIIESAAFRSCHELTSVTLGSGVEYIGAHAFDGTKITSIILPERLKHIQYGAFFDCTRLIDITFPDNFIYMDSAAFHNTAWMNNQPDGVVYAGNIAINYNGDRRSVTSIEIREGTLGIAFGAFKNGTISNNNYDNLTSVIIPDGLIHIGEQAFWDCTELLNVTIPESAVSVGHGAFHETAWAKAHDGVVYVNNIAVDFNDTNDTIVSVEVREGTVGIHHWGLSQDTVLMSISLPDSVTQIAESAFRRNFKGGLSVTYKGLEYHAEMIIIPSFIYGEPDIESWNLPQEFYNMFNN